MNVLLAHPRGTSFTIAGIMAQTDHYRNNRTSVRQQLNILLREGVVLHPARSVWCLNPEWSQ